MAEQRKLIKLGNSSFAIALPKDWIDKAGLKKGDSIFLERDSNGELRIGSKHSGEKNQKEIVINSEGKSEGELKSEIRVAYIKGYGIIKINAKEKQNRNNIKKIFSEFLSFEIIDSNEGEIIAKDFFSFKETNMSSFIRRMDNNTREILEIVIDEIKKGKVSNQRLKEIEEIDKDINKFYFLCARVFLMGVDNPSVLNSLRTNAIKLFNEWWFAFNLESLADSIKYFLKNWQKVEMPKEKVLVLLEEIKEVYLAVMDSFYKEDSALALKTFSPIKEIMSKIAKLEKEYFNCYGIFPDLNKMSKQIYQNARMVSYIKY